MVLFPVSYQASPTPNPISDILTRIVFRSQDAGFYSLDRVGGGASPDIVVYNGLTTGVDALLGSYGVRAVYTESRTGVAWTLTAFINGEIVWVEEGVFEALSYWLAVSESDLFTVTLDSADLLSC